ncbi:DoxX family protein [soil metagenome]
MTIFQPARAQAPARWIARGILAAVYVPFGFLHVLATDRFLPIMPAWVPAPHAIIVFTGLCEIFGGLGLILPITRWWAGVMLAAYAVCVFPANLHHALDGATVPGLPSSWWYHAPRLAFQPVFVWWALYAGGVIDWPFGRKRP